MAHPSDTNLVGASHALDAEGDLLYLLDHLGLHPVHQPAKDLLRRVTEDGEDHHRYRKTDDRIGNGNPAATPAAPRTTASDVRPSVRA